MKAHQLLVDELWGVVVVATWMGFLVRLVVVLWADFPLNDGGLFYVMVRDLQGNGYRLPAETSYNGAGIPFAYPPLTFYATAALNDLAGTSLMTVLRVLPLLASVLTIPAFFLVGRNILRCRLEIAIATLAFALIPRAFDWEIVGGGLTRSFGFLFAILALHQSTRLLIQGKEGAWAFAGLFAGITLVCHPEMVVFFAISHAVLLLFYARRLRPLLLSAGAAAVALAVSAPWWLWVLANPGIEPLLSAKESGPSTAWAAFRLLDPRVLNEPLFPLHFFAAWLGALFCLSRRRLLLPCWVLLLFVVDPRKAPTHATVPIALLVAVATAEVLWPLITSSTRRLGPGSRRAVAYGAVVAAILSSAFAPLSAHSPLSAISNDSAAAAEWAAKNTRAGASFAIVTGRDWPRDGFSEWFPALTGRQSTATVQGSEWAGRGEFKRRVEAYDALQECAHLDARCLEEWERDYGLSFTHVVVATNRTFDISKGPDDGCCEGLRRSLAADPRYIEVYSGSGATIFERRTGE